MMTSNVIQINHKFNETVKYYPNRMYSKERRRQFKSDKSKHRSALSPPPSNHLGIFEYETNRRHGALSKKPLQMFFVYFFCISDFFYSLV